MFGNKIVIIMVAAADANKELDSSVVPIILETNQFHGSMQKGRDDTDTNCWTSPSGAGFMIRGKNYLKDNSKVGFFLLRIKNIYMLG